MKESLIRFRTAVEYSLSFIVIFWIILIGEYLTGYDLYFLGIFPRTAEGLIGIITAPFIHADFAHLIANTIPFGVLCTLLFFFYKRQALPIFILLWIIAGSITWIIGRQAWHVGASIVIYALASFLFFGGIMSRKLNLILASIIVFIAYSGLIWGIFPSDGRVSWEGHLSGALSGFICAYMFRRALNRQEQQ